MIQAIIFDWVGTLSERGGPLLPNAHSVVTSLSPHYGLGLVSLTRDPPNRTREIQKTGLWDYFGYVCSDTWKCDEMYVRGIDALSSTVKTTLIVGDRMLREIQIGNRLGCPTCWISQGEYALEVPTDETGEPTYRIANIGELPMILARL